MTKEIKFYAGAKCTNGKREVVYRYKDGNRIFFSENGEYKSCNSSYFYSLGFRPIEPIKGGGYRAKPIMTREEYRRRNSLIMNANKE